MSWTIDLEAATATHPDGWVFHFSPADEEGAFDGECIGQPKTITPEMITNAPRIAQEAGAAFIHARQARH